MCYNIYRKKEGEYKMKNINIQLVKKGYAHATYKVCGQVKEMTDDALLLACDLNCFGGRIKRYNDHCAFVTVYTD